MKRLIGIAVFCLCTGQGCPTQRPDTSLPEPSGSTQEQEPCTSGTYWCWLDGPMTTPYSPPGTPTETCSVSFAAGGMTMPRCEFSNLQIGSTNARSIIIKNIGNGVLRGTIKAPSCADFSLSPLGTYAIPAGEQIEITAIFMAHTEGPSDCDIDIGASCEIVNCDGLGVEPPPTGSNCCYIGNGITLCPCPH